MGITIGAILFAGAVVLYVLYPLFSGVGAPLDRGWDEITDAEARKTAALRALRDVEYDYHTGKLDDTDYSQLRGQLTLEAVRALEEAEDVTSSVAAEGVDPIDQEVAALREGLRRGDGCGRCGHLNPTGSRYCARCGEALAASAQVG